MQVTIVGKNLEITDALRQYAEKKVAKVEKFFEQAPMEAQVTMGLERGKHIVEVTISVDGLLLRGEEKPATCMPPLTALWRRLNARSISIKPGLTGNFAASIK